MKLRAAHKRKHLRRRWPAATLASPDLMSFANGSAKVVPHAPISAKLLKEIVFIVGGESASAVVEYLPE